MRNDPNRGPEGQKRAAELIGRRVRWKELPYGSGTIVGIGTTSNGYVRYRVKWDVGSPPWWSSELAPGSRSFVVESNEPRLFEP